MIYSDYVTAVGATFQIPIGTATAAAPFTVTAYNTELPRSIDYIENRLQRELDIINTEILDSTGNLTANSKTFTLPTATGTFIVTEQVSIVVSGQPQAPMTPVSVDALLAMYPSDSAPSVPSYPTFWAPFNGTSIYVAPPPDTTYQVQVRGTQRVAQLSSTNTSNILTTLFPDLYIALGDVFWAMFQRDMMVEQGNEGQGVMGYEQAYKALMTPALVEQYRTRFRSAGWSSRFPPAIAQPPQT